MQHTTNLHLQDLTHLHLTKVRDLEQAKHDEKLARAQLAAYLIDMYPEAVADLLPCDVVSKIALKING